MLLQIVKVLVVGIREVTCIAGYVPSGLARCVNGQWDPGLRA